MLRKISVEEQRELIPDDVVKEAFMTREDIRSLPPEDRERRWAEHLKRLDEFRALLSGIPAIVLGE
jgi:hypothetical protein